MAHNLGEQGADGFAQGREYGFETRAVHAGHRPDPYTGASAVPLYQSSAFVFEDTDTAAAYFNLQEYGNIYSRIMNPTVAAFEERIANLEGGAGAVAFASGMAAQAGAFFTMLQPGDHLVASRSIYGGTITQLKITLAKISIDVTLVNPDDLDAWRAALRPNTKAFFAETIGNPGGNILDIAAVAEIAHAHGIPLVVDNTFATPYLCRPDRVGRGYRRPQRDQVHRRARHEHRRRGGGLRRIQLVQRQLPHRGRAVAGVSRAGVPRDLRHVRLPDEAARGDAARPGRRAQPVQRLPLLPRPGDAAAAHGAPRAERARSSPSFLERAADGRARALRRAGEQSSITRWRKSICRAARARSSPSIYAAGVRSGSASSRRCTSGGTWPTSAIPRAW